MPDHNSIAIVGIRLDYDSLYTVTKVRTFEHNYPQSSNYCYVTGKKLWTDLRKPVVGYDEVNQKLSGFKVEFSSDRGDAFICIAVATTTEYYKGGKGNSMSQAILNASLDQQKQKLKEALLPLGLWNEEEFGLWAVRGRSFI